MNSPSRGALLDRGRAADLLAPAPESVQVLARVGRRDVPEVVGSFVRTRWWTPMAPHGLPRAA
ncbi:hypothetical protein [Streptomyces viridochromogenes]|uniref:Uncharacterized protein n=1 Tax=Streptomyces viridochromogenes Tue57 TaxID=1160705 RepID=L8PIJ0_STRVR|nr:hypothetical protein [Streptomyces viridochromogenes]ELS56054.1 hypothetical protein STVIR_2987 [Streptomyces viridochromogenes Tue57]